MGKSYSGSHKYNDENWETLGALGVYDDVNWIVYKRKGDEIWHRIKVVALGAAPHKANYPMCWNGTRFAKCISFQTMAEHRNDLLKKLTSFMEKVTLSDI